MAARSVHRTYYIFQFELLCKFLIWLIMNFLTVFTLSTTSKSICMWTKTNCCDEKKNQQFSKFQLRIPFFQTKLCIMHTRCVILFVIIANSRLVFTQRYDLLCKNRVSNWKRSHFFVGMVQFRLSEVDSTDWKNEWQTFLFSICL